jgi:hypothetical protein
MNGEEDVKELLESCAGKEPEVSIVHPRIQYEIY